MYVKEVKEENLFFRGILMSVLVNKCARLSALQRPENVSWYTKHVRAHGVSPPHSPHWILPESASLIITFTYSRIYVYNIFYKRIIFIHTNIYLNTFISHRNDNITYTFIYHIVNIQFHLFYCWIIQVTKLRN